MSHTQMLRPNYMAVLAVTGTDEGSGDEEALRDPEAEAKRELLNHVLLERYGMDMGGRLGINSKRGKLAQIYISRMKEKKSEAEKAHEAVKQVDAIVSAFNKALDTVRFPKVNTSRTR